MEGFIKGLTKSVVHDINKNLKFSEIPVAIQRTYCKRYLGFDSKAHPAYHNNISEMIGDFSQYDNFKITHEPFIYIDNKNPKPTSIKEILERFGVDDVFKNLHGSFFDSSFESGKKITRNLERLKKIILMVSYEFPYKSSLSRFSLEPKKYKDRTLWQTFLDDLNNSRHKIVHGNVFENHVSIDDIKSQRDKVKTLQLLITYVLCSEISARRLG